MALPTTARHRGLELDPHAFVLRGLDLLGLSWHLGPTAPIQHGHRRRSGSERGAGRVHGRAAAADHDNGALQDRLLAQVDLLEEQRGRHHARQPVTRYAELPAPRRPGREEDGVVARLEVGQCEVSAHGAVELQLHAEADDAVDLCAQDVPRQAVLGDADGHHAAGHGHRLEHGHAIAQPGEVVGSRHSGRPAADDRDLLLALPGRRGDGGQLALLRREPLQAPDGDRLIEGSAAAGRLARSGADPAAHRRERIDLGGDFVGLVVAALPDQPDIAAGVGSGRARFLARRDRIPAVRDHRSPDLPVVRPLARSPVEEIAPGRDPGGLERFPGYLAQGRPIGRRLDGSRNGALARGQRRCAGDAVEHDDVGGAFADADAAADAFADLDGVFHHPVERFAEDARAFHPRSFRASHVERLHGANVHAHAAVQAVAVVDLDSIAHGAPRPMRIPEGILSPANAERICRNTGVRLPGRVGGAGYPAGRPACTRGADWRYRTGGPIGVDDVEAAGRDGV